MKQIQKLIWGALLIGFIQQVNAQSSARYQIHETPATKKHVIRGGAKWLGTFSEGFAIVGYGGGITGAKNFFVIDKKGNKVFDLPEGYKPSLYGGADSYYRVRFNSGRLLIEKEVNYSKEVSIIDVKGNIIKTFSKVSSASQFIDGVAVIDNQGWNKPPLLIDVNGNVISKSIRFNRVSGNYYWLGSLSEELRWYGEMGKPDKYGFLDANCKIVIPAKYLNCHTFSDGLAAVQNEEKLWGYIDKNGKYVIEPMFTYEPGDFHSGFAHVEDKSGKSHYIDKTAKVVWTAPDNNLYGYFSNSGYLINRGSILNTSFKRVAGYADGHIRQIEDDWFVVDTGWGYALYDYAGNYLLKFETEKDICDGIGCHTSYGDDRYYFNLKGEIIAKFEDTKF